MSSVNYVGEELELIPKQYYMMKLFDNIMKNGDLNCALAYRFHSFDAKIMEKALNDIIEDYDIFRMQLIPHGDTYRQRCLESYHYTLEVTEPDGETSEERFKNAYDEVIEDVSRIIPTGDNILWKCYLYHIADDDYFFVINIHHIVFDGFSEGLLSSLIVEYYEAAKKGTRASKPKHIGNYMDFVADELKMYEDGTRLKRHYEYWKKETEGYKYIDFSGMIGESSTESGMTKKVVMLDINRMNRIAERENTSRFAVLLAAYHMAITKISGASDTMISVATANRASKKYRNTLGLIDKSIKNRIFISPEDTVSEILEKTIAKVSQNISHQNFDVIFNDPNDPMKSAMEDRLNSDQLYFHCTYSPGVLESSELIFDGKPYEKVHLVRGVDVPAVLTMVYEYTDFIMFLIVADNRIIGSKFVGLLEKELNASISAIETTPEISFSEFAGE